MHLSTPAAVWCSVLSLIFQGQHFKLKGGEVTFNYPSISKTNTSRIDKFRYVIVHMMLHL